MRQRLTVRTEARLTATESTGSTAAGTAEVAAITATRTTRTAIATIAAGTTTTRTTRTTGTTRTTRTTRTTGTTRTTAAFATAAFRVEVARGCGQLPTDPGARQLAATRTIVILLLFFRCAELQAAEATRLRRTTIAAEPTTAATTTAAAATATAITTATTWTITAATIIATAATRRTRDAIDDVVELAARDRVVRSLLALEHAHETHLIDAVADDVERLDQPRCAIGLDVQRRRERLHLRIALGRCWCALRNRGLLVAARLRGLVIGGRVSRRVGGRIGSGGFATVTTAIRFGRTI